MKSFIPSDNKRKLRIAFIASTGGSVYRETCRRSPWLKDRVSLVITDRDCGAGTAAHELNHPVEQIAYRSARQFSEETYGILTRYQIDLAITFFTRILVEPLTSGFNGRLINLHPSLLPACPGLRGFEDSIKSGARIIGTTVHFVSAKLDEGPPILQSCIHRANNESTESLRHRIFEQQCRSLLQIAHWFEADRITASGDFVRISGAEITSGDFSPALDAEDAIALFESSSAC